MTEYEITSKERLTENAFRIRVRAPLIAEARRPGQFVILSLDGEYGERIPLTIVDSDVVEGTVTLVFQVVGLTTRLLSMLEVGDSLASLVGPLGAPTRIEKVGKVVCVAGGIGVTPLYPIAKAMKEAGNTVTVIQGARNAGALILEKEIAEVADEVVLCTDDGSKGCRALVTAPLKEMCEGVSKPDLVLAIGPPVMMKFCAETTRPYGVRTIVSLNSIMVDGTGMCGGCRVTVGGETRFVCVDGPEFDGHKVDFDNMIARLGSYRPCERAALECRLDAEIERIKDARRPRAPRKG